MALADFMLNLRSAAMFLFPQVVVTDPGLNSDRIEDSLRRADIWLTPRAVRGFDTQDYWFLPPDQREQLERDIESFRRVAEQVPPDRPATEDQVRAAIGPFRRIIGVLEPYLAPEWRRVYEVLTRLRFPPEVVGIVPEVAPDMTGEPAVWVWVTFDDGALEAPGNRQLVRDLESQVEGALRAAGITNQLYFGVRSRSEMPEVIGADADD